MSFIATYHICFRILYCTYIRPKNGFLVWIVLHISYISQYTVLILIISNGYRYNLDRSLLTAVPLFLTMTSVCLAHTLFLIQWNVMRLSCMCNFYSYKSSLIPHFIHKKKSFSKSELWTLFFIFDIFWDYNFAIFL